MPRHMGRVLVAVVVVGLLATLAYAGGMRRGPQGRIPPDVRRDPMARMHLTGAEQTAVREAMRRKAEARQPLLEQARKLQQVVDKPRASEAEYKRAVADYLSARDRTDRQVKDIDRGLMKRLSARAQAEMLAVGMIDNGMRGGGGPMHGMGGMGGMRGLRGGMRGGR